MAKHDVRLDSDGLAEVLKGAPMRAAIDDLADDIATRVRGLVEPGTEVVVDSYTTDRAAASVTIKDAQAQLWQVRDGVLTRAAADAGLEVKTR